MKQSIVPDPPNRGAYRIYIELIRDIKLIVGALGEFELLSGVYVYTGSAMRNLEARVARHLSSEKKIRWHIDYLLARPEAKIVKTELFPSDVKIECDLNLEILSNTGSKIPIPKFGSSDCSGCPAHLIKIQTHRPVSLV